MPLRMGWHLDGFPTRDYPGKMLETSWPGFDLGGGGAFAHV
jgi:hypothetical protein